MLNLDRERVMAQINEAVVGLEKRMLVKECFESIKEEGGIKGKVKRWGPKNGEIAYSFVYGKGKRDVILKPLPQNWKERMEKMAIYGGWKVPGYVERKKATDVLGLRLNHEGRVVLRKRECVDAPNHDKEINPLSWTDLCDHEVGAYGGYFKQSNLLGEFNILSGEGFQQFVQTLTNFYAGLKTGQGK